MSKLPNPIRDERVLHEIRGALAASDGQRAVALACRALDDGLRDPLLFYLRAKALIRQSKAEAAVQDLLQTLSLAPSDIDMRIACAIDLIGLEHAHEAIVVLRHAVRLDPGNWFAHFNLGRAYDAVEDIRSAIASYELTVALAPGHAVSRRCGRSGRQRPDRSRDGQARRRRAQLLERYRPYPSLRSGASPIVWCEKSRSVGPAPETFLP